MTLDEEILTETKTLRERLLDSERALEHLRADYHHAIRLLHARGGSMREIAEVLALSHQRVHQIVGEDVDAPREGERPGRRHNGEHRRGRQHGGGRGHRQGHHVLSRFTPEARAIVGAGDGEARALGHGSVEAEHLLLALVASDTAEGGRLRESGLDPDALRARVADAYPRGGAPRRGRIRFGHSARATVHAALSAALASGEDLAAPAHVAAALDLEGRPGAEVLARIAPHADTAGTDAGS
jgi:hypothetical protein